MLLNKLDNNKQIKIKYRWRENLSCGFSTKRSKKLFLMIYIKNIHSIIALLMNSCLDYFKVIA